MRLIALPDRAWKKTDLAYFAGLIDGEGCFGLGSRGTHIYACRLSIGNTNLQLLHWVKQRFGGTLFQERRNHPNAHRWKPIFRWVARSDDLDQIIPAILPYLVAKKEQAELILLYRQTLSPRIRTKRSTDDTTPFVKQVRKRIHADLAVLNRRGAAS